MITGAVKLTERQYRDLEAMSYSSLKEFCNSRYKFFMKYIMKDPEYQSDDVLDEGESVVLGSMVDCLHTRTEEDFSDTFVIIDTPRKSTQMMTLCDELWTITKLATDENGIVVRSFREMFEQAFNKTKYDKKGEIIAFRDKTVEKAMEAFNISDEKAWYDEKRKKAGKTIVSNGEIEKAYKLRDILYSTEWTKEILLRQAEGEWEVHKQQTFEYKIGKVGFKSMVDQLEINHKEKYIQPYDLKVSWAVEDFSYNYRKMRYYIQNGVYNTAIEQWIRNLRVDLYGYEVRPLKFIVADSRLQHLPVIWATDEHHLEQALHGFTVGGYTYKGVIQLIDELNWAMDTGNWVTGKEVFDNRGLMNITRFED